MVEDTTPMIDVNDSMTRVIVPMTSTDGLVAKATFLETSVGSSITKVVVLATDANSSMARDTFLVTGAGGLITKVVVFVTDAGSQVAKDTISTIGACSLVTKDTSPTTVTKATVSVTSAGWAIDFCDFLEKF